MSYHWITIEEERHTFLRSLYAASGMPELSAFVEASTTAETFDRARCDGLALVLGEIRGRRVAIAWSDFRANAGCFSHANSRRFAAFLRELGGSDDSPPLLYVVSSAGVSLMQGRALFSDAFGIWPALLAYSRRRLVVTCAIGKCLGLAAPLFGLGHYRVAVTGRTHINLTGPEVFRLFFGEQVDFADGASAERHHERTDLVHELVPSLEVAFDRWRSLIAPEAQAWAETNDPTATLLATFLDGAPQELVPGWCPSLRMFLGMRRGRPLGIFVNPLRRPNNLITARTLDKYATGLDLFRAMRVPIVSFLDSPGLDPRFEESDANHVRKMLSVGEKIIDYPHGAMGVVAGRCFGGASTLCFPKIFGASRTVALRGSTLGVMQSNIIDRLLRQSPRLYAEWRRTAEGQGPGLEDLIASGTLDAVVEPCELAGEIDAMRARVAPRPARLRRPVRLALASPARRVATNGHHANGNGARRAAGSVSS